MANLAKNCRRIIIGNPEKSLIAEILTAKMTFPGFNHQSVSTHFQILCLHFISISSSIINGFLQPSQIQACKSSMG
jgi:hypothetical protein